jgi:hypothetical protein
MPDYFSWLNLVLTVSIEACVLAAYAKRAHFDVKKIVICSIPLNIITQPAFSAWLRYSLQGQDYLWWQFFIAGEIVVWLIEAAAYAWLLRANKNPFSNALKLSAAANGASLIVGLLLP